jgi:6-pyruvoyltetrahydropterin/6-carboxytetrahydropterin synthase
VHETATGYAEAFREDMKWVDFTLDDIVFSDGIREEWQDPNMYATLRDAWYKGDNCFFNRPVVQQV